MEEKKQELFQMMPKGSFESFDEFSSFIDNEGYESVFDAVKDKGYFESQEEYISYFNPNTEKKNPNQNATESPSSEVQGQSSLGSQSPPTDISGVATNARNNAFGSYLKQAVDNGYISQEEAASENAFDIIASSKAKEENPIDNLTLPDFQSTKFKDFNVGAAQDMLSKQKVDAIKKTDMMDIQENVKSEILSTIPEEDRTPEKISELEEGLWLKEGIKLNLNPEESSQIGTEKGTLSPVFSLQKGVENATLSVASLFAQGNLPFTGYDYVIDDVRKSEMKRLSDKVNSYEGDILDNLKQGNISEAIDLTAQQTMESLPMMAVAAATDNPYLAYSAITAISGAQQYQDVKNEEWFRNMSDGEQLSYISLYGGAEAFGEMMGGRVLKRSISSLGSEALSNPTNKSLVKDFFKQRVKDLGLAIKEEGLGEGMTGLSQYVLDANARGEDITLEGAQDAFVRSAVAGIASGSAMTSAPTAIGATTMALNSIPFKKVKKAQKELKEDIENTQNPIEREVLANELVELNNKKSEIVKEEANFIENLSENDKAELSKLNTDFEATSAQLSQMEEGSKAYDITKNKLENILGDINNIRDKKDDSEQEVVQEETKIEEDAVQVSETTEVPSESETQPVQEVEGEVRGEQEDTQTTEEEGVNLKYEVKQTPKQFKDVEGGDRVFKEAAGVYNKSLDRRTGESVANQNAIDYIQGTKAYENANDVQRDAMVKSFQKEVGENIKSSPSPDRLFDKPKDKKVDMTDKQVVRQRIMDMSKAAKDGYRQSVKEVKDYATQIDDIVKEIPKGVLSSTQSKQLARAAKGVRTPSQMRRFENFSERLFSDVEYSNDLIKASSLKTNLSKGTKNLPSNIAASINDFLQIKENQLTKDELVRYNQIAQGLIDYKKKPKTKLEDGVNVTTETEPISLNEVQDFIYLQNTIGEKRLVEDMMEENKELFDNGIVDAKMSYNEIKEIIDAITGDDVDSFTDMKDGAKKKEAFKRVVSFLQEDLKQSNFVVTGNLDKQNKNALENIDIDQLTANQLASLYVSLQNAIYNNAYNGSHKFSSIYKAQQNTPKIEKLYTSSARAISDLSAKVANIPALMRAMTGSREYAAEVRVLSGMSGVFNGTARAKKQVEKVAEDVKSLIGKKFENIALEENAFLTMYSTLLTVNKDNFDQYKRHIRDVIDNDLKSKDKEISKSASIIMEVYQDKIANAKNVSQIKLTAKEKKILDYIVGIFADIKPRFKEVSENVYNIGFQEVDGTYIPLLIRNRMKSDVSEISISSTYEMPRVNLKKDGSLNSRKYTIDPIKQTLDFDFLNGVINKYSSQLTDIETATSISDFNAIMASPNVDKAFNGMQDVIRDRMKTYVNGNKIFDSMTPAQKIAVDGLNWLAKVGTRLKLGGFSQAIVQSVPVFLRTAAILGKDTDLVFNAVDKSLQERELVNKLLNKYPISLRGYLKQEFASVDKKIPKARREKWRSTYNSISVGLGDIIDKVMMGSIEAGDVGVARATWLAFYVKSLKDQGLYDGSQSLEDIVNNPNDLAAEFAEQMIAETQVPSDVSQNGYFFSNNDSVMLAARRAAFPFITFRANQTYSILNSMYGLKGKDMGKAALELAGVFTENTVYGALSTARYLAALTGASFIAGQFGIDIDKDDEETKMEKYQRWVSSVLGRAVSELNPFYGYGFIDSQQIGLINKFYFHYVLSDDERMEYINQKELRQAKTEKDAKLVFEKALNNFSKTKKAPMKDYSKNGDGFEAWGSFGFPLETAQNVKETYDMSNEEVYSYVNKWNATQNIKLSDAERDLLKLSALMQLSNFVVYKEIGDVGRYIKSGIQYKDKEKEKGFDFKFDAPDFGGDFEEPDL